MVAAEDWAPERAAQAIAARITARGLDFSAGLAAGDVLAAGAMLEAQQAGYSIPEDIFVLGIDDLPQAAFLTPPLTCIHVPKREIGMIARAAARGAVGPPPPVRRVELACLVVERALVARGPRGVRETSAKPPKSSASPRSDS